MYKKIQIKFNKLRKTIKELSRSWQVFIILVLLTLISLSAFYVFIFIDSRNKQTVVKIVEEIKEVVVPDNIPAHYVRRRIDGMYVDPAEANLYPVAIMIDNDPNARPQAGLAHASIVYEAKAESNITRFMAIFASKKDLSEIGPVRSARPYYLDWASGYDALYAHVGGSPEALAQIKDEKVFNINEYYNGSYFWRDKNKIAPHYIFTSSENLKKYLDKWEIDDGDYESLSYKEDLAESLRLDEQEINISFDVFDFDVKWVYNKEENNYTRYMGGFLHKDADKTQVLAKNIIIMEVASKTIDSELRKKMNTIGRGQAIYCFDGQCKEGVWEKKNKKTREKIFDSNQQEVEFNSGTTWIEVVQNISNTKY